MSACNTGSGKVLHGEGVIGMGRAFLAAGSNKVIVSLWPVAFDETTTFMIDFYRRLTSEIGRAHV